MSDSSVWQIHLDNPWSVSIGDFHKDLAGANGTIQQLFPKVGGDDLSGDWAFDRHAIDFLLKQVAFVFVVFQLVGQR